MRRPAQNFLEGYHLQQLNKAEKICLIGRNFSETNTADLLVKCLENEGVRFIFGIPGEENLDLIHAVQNSSIRFILTRHEQGAAFMADMYGRLTGNAGVCLSTLGPGATNLVTGVADANLDGSPVVAITGQVGTDKMHITSHQYLDLTEMFRPITKRSKQIVRPDTVTEIVRLAFKYAESEKPGAVHIDLPDNIARMPVSGQPLQKMLPQKGAAESETIRTAAALIGKAKRPMILVGSSAVRSHADAAITEFAEKLRIPVVNTMMAKGMVPCDNRYYLGTIGVPQEDSIACFLHSIDLMICIGYDLVEYSPNKWNTGSRIKVIHIGTKAADINKDYQPTVEVIGQISDSLFRILRNCSLEGRREPEEALLLKKRIMEERIRNSQNHSFPMKPQTILSQVREILGHEDILISDVGAHKVWVARNYDCYCPNTCIISNGFASMGIAIPGAVSAKLIYPDKKVLAITGDGGFMMNMQELETAVRNRLAFVVLIWNDSSYGLIKWKEQMRFSKTACVDFTNPNFKALAESMHCKGYRVEKADDLMSILQDAFRQKVPSVIDCQVDYDENIKLSMKCRAPKAH